MVVQRRSSYGLTHSAAVADAAAVLHLFVVETPRLMRPCCFTCIEVLKKESVDDDDDEYRK